MTASSRPERVSRHIRNTLAEILRRHVKDPRLRLVTITSVDVSPDLRQAKIYFATTGDDEKIKRVLAGFEKARPYIKKLLGQELGLRYMPEIRFYYDDSLDYGARMEELFRSIGEADGHRHRPTD
jgi:ribosome-binding factor A